MKKQKEKVVRFEMKLSYDEDDKLKSDSQKANLTKSEYVRRLIMNCRFYDILRNLTKIGNNLNQIAYRANYSNLIDKNYYDENAKEVRKFVSQIREEYL